MELLERAKNILLRPKDEWPKIAAEKTPTLSPYVVYVSVLAAIGPLALLVGSMGTAIFLAVFTYAFSFFEVFMLALTIDVVRPSLGGERNFTQSFKLVAYSYTASWVAAVAQMPLQSVVGGIIGLVAAIYGVYIFYLGVPVLAQCPRGKSVLMTIIFVVCAILLSVVLAGLLLWGVGAVLGMEP